ncbi:MAG: hypothetical protein QM831_11255 [Kofleriaceae bacterium]
MQRTLAILLLAGTTATAGTLESRVCKLTDKRVGIRGAIDLYPVRSPDGVHALGGDDENGFRIDADKAKSVHVHLGCDLVMEPNNDDPTWVPDSDLRWLTNEVVFAHGRVCDSNDVKPFLVTASGKLLGYVALPKVSFRTSYQFAQLEGSTWLVSVFDEEAHVNYVSSFDLKSGKLRATKQAADFTKLPDCK